MDLATELQKIYDSEINVSIGWLWDEGIDVRLGDLLNGFLAEENVPSTDQIVPWLQEARTSNPTPPMRNPSLPTSPNEPEPASFCRPRPERRSGVQAAAPPTQRHRNDRTRLLHLHPLRSGRHASAAADSVNGFGESARGTPPWAWGANTGMRGKRSGFARVGRYTLTEDPGVIRKLPLST